MYNVSDFTYGVEIEWGDVDRRLTIPGHLGKWEYSETDIVNSSKYGHVACDPLGIDPPYGGEINTFPTHTIDGQLNIYNQLYEFFVTNGCRPYWSFISHTHVHVHIPGLIDDIDALKRLTRYIKYNQRDTVNACLDYKYDDEVSTCKRARSYFKYDGGRLMPDWMCDNILQHANDFESFILLQCSSKDGICRNWSNHLVPYRYAINTYCLKHINTIEFRCFRHVRCAEQLGDILSFVTEFLDAALNDGDGVEDTIIRSGYEFPEMEFHKDLYDIWYETKWDKSRGKKAREYVDIG